MFLYCYKPDIQKVSNANCLLMHFKSTIQKPFKMACSPIFGFFRYTFLQWFSLGPMGQVQYYGTSRRCLAAILADLQALIGITPRKHEISLKMGSGGSNLLWGCISIKNYKKLLETLDLDVPSCQSWKIWKNHTGSPPRSAFACKNPYGAPQGYKSGRGRLHFGFLAKNH